MRVLFKVFAQASHHNSSFCLARSAAHHGNQVVYAVTPPLKRFVEAQGFDCYVQSQDFIPGDSVSRVQANVPLFTHLKLTMAFWKSRFPVQRSIESCSSFDELVSEIRPELVLVDSPYAPFALSLFKFRIPFAIIETTVPTHRSSGTPPLCSRRIPDNSSFSKFASGLEWQIYYIKRRLKAQSGLDPFLNRGTLKRAARRARIGDHALNFSKYLQLGIDAIPEFVLTPQEFDFPRKSLPNQRFINCTPDIDRFETGYDFDFDTKFKEVSFQRTSGTRVVFCALGTAAWRYKGVATFYRKLVEASRGSPWILILAMPDISQAQVGRVPANVLIFDKVPQLRVLRDSDLMINHGGMNSIAECIMLKVPCLVFPGERNLDQFGNGARVEFHRIGRSASLNTSSSEDIARLVLECLNNDVYKRSVCRLREKIVTRTATSDPWRQVQQTIDQWKWK